MFCDRRPADGDDDRHAECVGGRRGEEIHGATGSGTDCLGDDHADPHSVFSRRVPGYSWFVWLFSRRRDNLGLHAVAGLPLSTPSPPQGGEGVFCVGRGDGVLLLTTPTLQALPLTPR